MFLINWEKKNTHLSLGSPKIKYQRGERVYQSKREVPREKKLGVKKKPIDFFTPTAYVDLKHKQSLQYTSSCEHRSELPNSWFDIQTPSSQRISAESREINRLRKQICWWMKTSRETTRLRWPRCRFHRSSHVGKTKGYKPFPFLLRGKGERETRRGGGEIRKGR